MTTGGERDLSVASAIIISVKDKATEAFQKQAASATKLQGALQGLTDRFGELMSMIQGSGLVRKLGEWMESLSKKTSIFSKELSAAGGALSRLGTLGSRITTLVTSLGLAAFAIKGIVALVGGLTIAAAGAAWVQYAQATRRAQVQLQTLGLSASDARAAIERMDHSLGRSAATSVLQNSDAVGALIETDKDFIAGLERVSKQVQQTYGVDAGVAFAAARAIADQDLKRVNELLGLTGDAAITSTEELTTMVGALDDISTTQIEALGGDLKDIAGTLLSWAAPVAEVLALLTRIVTVPLKILIELLDDTFLVIKEVVTWVIQLGEGILAITGVLALVTVAWAAVKFIVDSLVERFNTWKDQVTAFWNILSDIFDWIDDFANGFTAKVLEGFILWGKALVEIGAWLIDKIPAAIDGIAGAFTGVVDILSSIYTWLLVLIPDAIGWVKDKMVSMVTTIADLMRGAFRAVLNPIVEFLNVIIRMLNRINPFDDIPEIPLPEFHRGGIVPGLPGQEVPIMAMAGERVIPTGQNGSEPMVINLMLPNGDVLYRVVVDRLLRDAKYKAQIVHGAI